MSEALDFQHPELGQSVALTYDLHKVSALLYLDSVTGDSK